MNVSPLVCTDDLKESYKSGKYADASAAYFKKTLPLFPTVELAEIAADLMTDGHIAIRDYYKSKKYSYVGFFSDDLLELERFQFRIKKIFGMDGNIREWGIRKNGRSKGCIIADARLCRLLELCGIPAGDKVTQKYRVPRWIMAGDRKIKRAFLRRSFTCEGSISMEKSGRWDVRYSLYKQESMSANAVRYMESLRKLLRGFDIKTYRISLSKEYLRHKDKRKIVGFVLRIRDKQSLINYAREIRFDTDNKISKLYVMSSHLTGRY